MEQVYDNGIVGFEDFLSEKVRKKQQKFNLLEMKIFIVLRPKAGDKNTKDIILVVDFKIFLWKFHREWKIGEISGIFINRKDAEDFAKRILEKFKRKKS